MMDRIRDRFCPPQHREALRTATEAAHASVASLAAARALRAAVSQHGQYIDREVEKNHLREDFERAFWPTREDPR